MTEEEFSIFERKLLEKLVFREISAGATKFEKCDDDGDRRLWLRFDSLKTIFV